MDVQSMNEYPFNTVLLIKDTFGPQSFSNEGTGVLISPDEVLTANHVVYFNNGTPSDSVVANLDSSFNVYTHPNGLPAGVNASPVGAQNIHYNPVEQDAVGSTLTNSTGEVDPQYDFAVIHLSTPLTANGYMGLSPDYAGGTVDQEGWYFNNNQSINDFETNNTLSLVLNAPTDGYNYYNGSVTLNPGESGGPNYLFNLSTKLSSVVATNTSEGTGQSNETAITSQAVAEIEFWLSQDGESPGIIRLYHGVLGRAPDQSGLTTYSSDYTFVASALQGPSGNPLNSPSAAAVLTADLTANPNLVDDFLNSTEFQNAHPNISNSDLVGLLYQQALGRTASGDSGATTWINELNNGTITRETAVIGIVESPEAITHAGIFGVPTS